MPPIYPDLSSTELAALKLAIMDYIEARSEGRDTPEMEAALERRLARVPVQHTKDIEAFTRELALIAVKDGGGGHG